MKGSLAAVIDQRAQAAVDEAARLIDDANSEIDWCKQADENSSNREGVEARRSALSDICAKVAGTEHLLKEALLQAELAAKAAPESDQVKWQQAKDKIQEKWDELQSQLQKTR